MKYAYRELEQLFQRLSIIGEAVAFLEWDKSVMMPPKGSKSRAEQTTTLKLVSHELLTDPIVEEALGRAEADVSTLDDWQVANLRKMRWRWVHATVVPADLLGALTRVTSRTALAWRGARVASDFNEILPHLTELLNLMQEFSIVKSEALKVSPYEALVDIYEPGLSIATIDKIFRTYSA